MPTEIRSAHVLAGHGLSPRPALGRRILQMLSVLRSRRDLAHLSDDQLRDIGLTREQVNHEISRPIWDVPTNWRR